MSLARRVARIFTSPSGGLDPAHGGTPPGAVMAYGALVAPAGWLLCDGSAVSRTTYANLFAAIGTLYGLGNGTTTFNLPDLRGRIPAGKDNMGGTAANRLTVAGGGINGIGIGAVGGSQSHVLTEAQMPSHTHTATTASAGAHTHTANGVVTGLPAISFGSGQTAGPTDGAVTTSSAGAHTHAVTVAVSGSDAAHPNVQPSIIMSYIIKT